MSKILCFTPLPTHSEATFYTIDDETFESKMKICIINKNSDLPRKNVKAVIFRFTKAEQKESAKMAKMLEDYYSKYKIPFFCCSWNSIYLSAALMAAVDEHGDGILKDDMDFIFCEDGCFGYFKINKIENQYRITLGNLGRLSNSQLGSLFTRIDTLTNIFITCPSPVPEIPVLEESERNKPGLLKSIWEYLPLDSPNNATPQQVQEHICQVFASKPITVINKDINTYLSKAIVNKCLCILGGQEDSFKFDVANTAIKSYGLTTTNAFLKMFQSASKPEKMEKFIIKILISDVVPIQRTIVYFKSLNDILIMGAENMRPAFSDQHFDPGTTLKFSVDKHFLFHPYIKKDDRYTKNAAFICLKNDENDVISVDLVRNGKMEKNGKMKNKKICLAVDGNVQVGHEALELKETFNSFVITDLLTIMMTECTDLEIDPGWGFTVFKNINSDEILLEFDTFRGRRKSSLPFLFALILKWTILKIEQSLGQTPDTVVIASKEMNDTLKEQLKISFEITKLKILDFQIHRYKIIEIVES